MKLQIITRPPTRRRLKAYPVKASRLTRDFLWLLSFFLVDSSMTVWTSGDRSIFFKPPAGLISV